MRARLSLKARAIAWLAQREQSRVELRRKLLRRARADAAADATAARALRSGDADASAEPGGAPADIEASVEELLDWLEAHDYLSPARFADARLHARAARHGTERIRHELARHGVTLDAAALQALRESELQRAQALWQRRFGGAAADASARARQARFLAGRGFSAEVIRRVVKGCVEG